MATKKRRSKKSSAADDGPEVGPDGIIVIPTEPENPKSDNKVTINAATGTVEVTEEDGSILIDPTGETLTQDPDEDPDAPNAHDYNLALKVDPIERSKIAEDLFTGIEDDKQGRSPWEQMRAKCIELLGLKLEDPKGDVSRSALGMSTSVVRDPTLLQAVEFARATSYGELCPSSGPFKVEDQSESPTQDTEKDAQDLQDDLNYWITQTASEYYPDTYFMLWWTSLASGTFKKVYKCPLRRRPVSEYVDGTDLIVSTSATDLKNASRVTHEIKMRKSVMRRMQILGVYRDVPLWDPLQPMLSAVTQKRATIEGKNPQPQRPEDQDYTVYECCCELDIKGFEHKDGNKVTGLPLPYRVTLDVTSREILEIRRNWDEDDEDQIAQIPFVLFPFSTGLSRIYGSGLGQMMGNMAAALTALLRISIDNGMLGNYPGMLKAKGSGRDLVNEIMVPPGGCMEVDTGGAPRIQDVFMGLPYKDVSPSVMSLIEQTRGVAQNLGGTMNAPVAEGKQDAPVGTTLAMIEQQTKPASATHKIQHMAQSEEFRLLIRLFKDDPDSLWRGNRRPALGMDREQRVARFKRILENCDIVPASDPNVPSELHRKLGAIAFQQMMATVPGADQVAIAKYVARAVNKMPDSEFDKMIQPAPQGPPPIDPATQADLAIKKQLADIKGQQVQVQAATANKKIDTDAQIKAAQLAHQHMQASAPQQPDPLEAQALTLKARAQQLSETKLAVDAHNAHQDRLAQSDKSAMDIASRLATHPESQPIVNSELQGLGNYMTPPDKSNSMGAGGTVGGRMDEEAVKADKLASENKQHLANEIARILREMPMSGYAN